MEKLLIIDDSLVQAAQLKSILEDDYEITIAQTGEEGLSIVSRTDVSLILLDVVMPGMDGFAVLRQVRKENNIPVLILSARDTDADKILGLDLGADDYLTKPINPLEAVARVNSNIRRFYALGAHDGGKDAHVLEMRDLKLDLDGCILYRGGEEIELTSVEYRLMRLFLENPGKVFTKEQIFRAGWNCEYMEDDNNVMVCISKLRAKLSDDANHYIRTIRGLGYRFEKI